MNFACGFLLGVIAGTVYWAAIANISEKKSVSQGVIKIDGEVYKLTKIDITEE